MSDFTSSSDSSGLFSVLGGMVGYLLGYYFYEEIISWDIFNSEKIDKAKILEKSELLNKSIRDSNLHEDIRIGAIVRKNQVIIPRSNFVFEKDDLVVFLAKREQLKAVEDLFSVGSI